MRLGAKRRLGDLCEQVRGVSYEKSEASTAPGGSRVPILRANNIGDAGDITLDDLVYVPERRVGTHQHLRSGDIVVATSSGSIDVVGKASLVPQGFTGSFGAFCKVMRPNTDAVDPRYLALFMRSPEYRFTISQLAGGANINNLRNEHLNCIEIPLPPLPEQKRIAAILDKADAIRRKRQESVRLADDFLRSAFLDMFGDPVTNPKGWPRQSLGGLLDHIDSGWSPVCEDRQARPDEWSVLKLGAVTSCVYLDEENKALAANERPRPDIEVKCGDLLFSRKNTYELVAACALVTHTVGKRMLSDLTFRLCIRKSAPLVPEYLWGLLTTASKRRSVQALAGGSAGSMPNISKEKLRTVMVELPPVAAQQQYAALLRRVRAMESRTAAGAEDAALLFQSLSHRAFAGDL